MPRKTNTTINGSDYFRVTATIGHNSDGRPLRKQFYGDSKKDAEAKRDAYLLNIHKGLSLNFDKATFGGAFKAWFENVLKPSISLSSYNRYKIDYRLRIKESALSALKLTDVRAIHVQSYYNGLLESFSVNTVKQTHKLLKSFFIYCVKADLIIKNPLLAVELPHDDNADTVNTAISNNDVEKFLQAARNDINQFIYVFAVFSGLRLGEITALTHKDINFKDNQIHVNKSMKYLVADGEYKPVVNRPKTDCSVRDVPILDEIQALLKAHIRYEKEKHFKLSIPFSEDCILFSSTICGYREGPNVRKALGRLCKRLDMNDTTFHSLRHTFCTILARQGVSLKAASVLMGHSNISITAKIYTKIDQDELKKEIQKLSVYFKK